MKKIILILFCMIFVLQNAIYAQEAGKISASLGFDDQSDMNALAPDEAEIFKKEIAGHQNADGDALKLSGTGDDTGESLTYRRKVYTETEKNFSEILKYPKYQTKTYIYLSCVNKDNTVSLNYSLGSVYADERYTVFDADAKRFVNICNFKYR